MTYKVVFACGSHPRHMYIAQKLKQAGRLAALVIEERENFNPEPEQNWDQHLQDLFKLHFKKRNDAENKFFGDLDLNHITSDIPILRIKSEELNSSKTKSFLSNYASSEHMLFTYGVHRVSDELISLSPNRAFNIHGGLSPWYRGNITLFWPFYFLKPNYTGMTIHRLSPRLDAGDILHHSVPKLIKGDGLHDVACRAVIQVANDLIQILDLLDTGKELVCIPQKGSGKLFNEEDWTPQNLTVIYDLYDDQIVDRFLEGYFVKTEPELVNFLK